LPYLLKAARESRQSENKLRNNCMEQNPFLETGCLSAGKEIPRFYKTRGVVTAFISAQHWT